jgi:hypothetical protein
MAEARHGTIAPRVETDGGKREDSAGGPDPCFRRQMRAGRNCAWYGSGAPAHTAHGFAGIDNELFYMDKTLMLFGDAKAFLGSILKDLAAAKT